jgi:tellurite resistance protein
MASILLLTCVKPRLISPENLMHSDKLAHLPIALFASVMGLSGLAMGWLKAGQIGNALALDIGWVIRVAASLLLLTLVFFYALKSLRYPDSVKAEFAHPIKINFFATIPIGLVLMATLWSSTHPGAANVLWWVGATLMLILTLLTMSHWIHHTHYQFNHLNPAWFIPVVGNVLIPIAGVRLGHVELSWFFFSIGIIFWLVLMTIVMNRLIFHDPLQDRMRPTLFILLAPPAVGFLSYVALNAGNLDAFARVLYFTGLFLVLLLMSNASHFLKLPFFISGWAYSFPVAAMALASFEMGVLSTQFGFTAIGWAMLTALTVIVIYLAYKTLEALLKGRLLVPEQH